MTAEVEAADQLLQHEAIIEQGLGSFLDVGASLIAIRDGKLYLATHSTFEAYCTDRWQIARPYAYRLIDAAQTVGAMSPIGDILPTTESQARELTGLPPEVAAQVMTAAAESGKVTAASIKTAREHIAPTVKVTETTRTESYVDTATGEVVAPPAELPTWKQNLRAQEESKIHDKAAAKAVTEFPELAYYVGKGDPGKAVSTAANLRAYSGTELDVRRAALGRAIEADRDGVFDRIAQEVDYLTPAQDVFFIANEAAQAIARLDPAATIAAALAHGVEPVLVNTWRTQFADLAGLCADLAAACQPQLRSVR
jgi:hypothetical protein